MNNMKVIDFRLRPPYGDFKTSYFFDPKEMAKYQRQQRMEQSASAFELSMEKCLQEMDETGTVLGVAQANIDLHVSNETIAEIVEKYPKRFVGCIDLDFYDIKKSLYDIDKFIVNGPCSGITCEPAWLFNGIPMPFDDARIYPVFEKCQEEGIFVIYPTGMGYDKLENGAPERLDKVAREFPELTIIVSHAGWPWVNETCWIANKRPNVYLSPDQYIFNTPGMNDYVIATNNMLQDKMIYGSCYPFVSLKAGIDYTLGLGIKEEALQKYMFNNALKVLKLDPAQFE